MFDSVYGASSADWSMSAVGANGRIKACRICIVKLGVVTHTSNPSSRKAEADVRPAWAT